MTAPDVRTAAQAEAETRYAVSPDDHMLAPAFAELRCEGFTAGAVWGAALVAEGIMISDFQGDGVYRDQQGRIWQTLDDTRAAVEATIAITEARVTPTREQIAEAVAEAQNVPFVGRKQERIADAVLALMQDRTTT